MANRTDILEELDRRLRRATGDGQERNDRDQALGEIVTESSESYAEQAEKLTKLQGDVEELKRVIGTGAGPGPGTSRSGSGSGRTTLGSPSLFGDPHKISEYTEDFEEWQWKIRARLEELKDCDETTKICYVMGRTTGTVFDSVAGALPGLRNLGDRGGNGGGRNRRGGDGGNHVKSAEELLESMATRYVAYIAGPGRR